MNIDYFQILVFVCHIVGISAYSSGAPGSECITMIPGHGPDFQSSPSPYAIKVVPNGNDYMVSIESTSEFKGFILGSFNGTDKPFAAFLTLDESPQYLCGRAIVTHSRPLNTTNVSLSWSPGAYVGSVTFKATVVRSKLIFWRVTMTIEHPMTTTAPATTLAPATTTAPPATTTHAPSSYSTVKPTTNHLTTSVSSGPMTTLILSSGCPARDPMMTPLYIGSIVVLAWFAVTYKG